MKALYPQFEFTIIVPREQSFNCGKDNPYVATVAQVAAANHAVFFVTTSGSLLPSHCNSSTDTIPYASEQWHPSYSRTSNSDNEKKFFAPSAAEVDRAKADMVAMHSLGPSASQ